MLSDSQSDVDRVYAEGRWEALCANVALYPHVVGIENFDRHAESLRDVEVAFSTWGMPELVDAHLDRMPSLRALFYAAGSVQSFARPFLARDIAVVSAWAANAVPVAEFALGQVLLACKGYFRNERACRDAELRHAGTAFKGAGVFGETVGLIGVGKVGRALCRLLEPAVAGALGIELVDLPDVFPRAYVVSNHLPDIQSRVAY